MNKRQLILGLMLGAAAAVSAQSLTTWTKYKAITVNTTAGGANVATDVAKFPVLVRLNATNAADVFAQAQPGGSDIRFSNAAGTAVVPHEIESWNSTAQTAAIWVLADTVKGNSNTASLRIYWGKGGVPSGSNGAAVFDTAAGWRGVWHMGGGSGALTEKNATVHNLTMTASDSVAGSVPTDTVGVIGRARTFAGDANTVAGRQYFVANNTAANPAVDDSTNRAHTISAWVYARTISAANGHGNSIFNKGDRQYAFQIYGATGATAKKWESATYTSTWRQIPSKGTSTAAAGAWYHITGTWTGGANATNGTGQIFVNGVLDSTASLAIGTTNPVRTYNLFIGANPSAGSNTTAPGSSRSMAGGTSTNPRFWDGHIDEVTFSRAVRSADFVKLSFETQKATANAVSLGTTQTQTVAADTVRNIRYVMPGVGTTPRDTLVFGLNVPVNLPLLYDGGPIDSAKITGNTVTLPTGLSINLTTGLLSGTPTAAFAAANRTLTVYSSLGTVTRGLRISAVFVPGPMANFDYAVDTAQYVVGLPITANAPSWSDSGRAPTGFSVTPALPAGLSLNATSGVISGTPTAIAAATNHTVRATNATDTLNKVIRITVVSAGTEDYAGTAWPNKQVVYLNTQANGAAVTGGVANFPVLIRLNATNFNTGFTQAAAGGADIRFTKVNNTTRLSHQIERWDATAKVAEIWVRLDTIPGNKVDSIRMHWGNATAPSLSSGPTVFDTAAGFQAVWHMNAPSGAESDATPNGFGAAATSDPGSAAGIVGPARTFNGTSQFFSVPGTASGRLNFTQTDSYTLSAWFNPTVITTATAGAGHKIIDKGDNQYVLAIYGNDPTTRFWEITTRGNNTYNQCQSDGAFPGSKAIPGDSSLGAWHHLVGTYKGGAVGATDLVQHLYYDGVLVNQCPLGNENATGRNENHNVHIGVQSGTAPSGNYTRHWNGLIDEPRLHNRARSGDWVKLEFQNQRAAQTLVSFTRPTSISGNPAASMLGQGFSVRAAGQGLVFQLQGAHEGKAVMSLVDMYGRTVWSGAFAAGSSQLQWNGNAQGGASVSSGIYVARLTLLNQGKAVQVMDRKVPYTR